jgi:hypothetical protein
MNEIEDEQEEDEKVEFSDSELTEKVIDINEDINDIDIIIKLDNSTEIINNNNILENSSSNDNNNDNISLASRVDYAMLNNREEEELTDVVVDIV